jgi:phosphohistidine phosphatase
MTSTLRLILTRHGHSTTGAPSDLERPLSPEGRAQALDLGGRLSRWPRAWHPHLILVSPARRTQETLAQMISAWPLLAEVPTRTGEELYLGDPERWLARLTPLTMERTVLCVGHNPGLSDLVGALSGEHASLSVAEAVGLTLRSAASLSSPHLPHPAPELTPEPLTDPHAGRWEEVGAWLKAPSGRWRLEGRACGRAEGEG